MDNEPTVFVVDDEPVLLASIAHMLKLSGFTVEVFKSAAEFLDHFKSGQQGCLLLDVRLPGMSGIELQRRLHADRIDLPVILMSGHASDAVREIAMDSGAVSFLAKPLDAKKLVALVRASIEDVCAAGIKEPQL